jgi:hypothetical protein
MESSGSSHDPAAGPPPQSPAPGSGADAPSAAPAKPRRPNVWWTRLLLLLIALMCITGLWAWRQWRRVPDYWSDNQKWLARDNATLLQAAQDLERQMLAAVSAPAVNDDTGEERQVMLSFRQINAWLALRLEDWSANQRYQLPKEVTGFMVGREGEHLVAAFHYQTREIDQIASVLFDLKLQPDGKAILTTHGLRAGMLPLPVTAMTQHLQTKQQIAASALREAITALEGKAFDPVISHPGHASMLMRLVGLHLDDEGIIATVRTERRPARQRNSRSVGASP